MIGFWKWGFRATVKIHCADDESNKVAKGLTFHDLVTTKLGIDPAKKLWLNPLLFNGTLQTLYYAMHDSGVEFQTYYGRELFTYTDGGVCSLDWVIPPEPKDEFDRQYKVTLPANSPRLHPRTRFLSESELSARDAESTDPLCVVFHGLAGGSHEPLIRNLAQELGAKGENWGVVVVNSRGCCRTKITLGKLFNALSTDDLREVLESLRERYPRRKLYAVGFSFGAVLLANYLGECGPAARGVVSAAVLIGCAWDMTESARHIDRSLSGRYLFNPSLTAFLNKLVKANRAELAEHTDWYSEEVVQTARKAKKTYQWDNAITCKTAGFDTSWKYYDAASPSRRVHSIDVPTLVVNSTDDPAVSPNLPLKQVQANPHVALVETNLGGHLGWVQSLGRFWCVELADRFINEFHCAASDT